MLNKKSLICAYSFCLVFIWNIFEVNHFLFGTNYTLCTYINIYIYIYIYIFKDIIERTQYFYPSLSRSSLTPSIGATMCTQLCPSTISILALNSSRFSRQSRLLPEAIFSPSLAISLCDQSSPKGWFHDEDIHLISVFNHLLPYSRWFLCYCGCSRDQLTSK